tara:strand:- start:10850 stop:12109 length:1260 start_codon:yes stop_codon:yes gene_type:complete
MEISKLYEVFKSCNNVFTDTRKIIKGGIYFALKGDNFDGNDFANEAIKNGAKYAVIDSPNLSYNKNIIKVQNTLSTLQKLAKYHRDKLRIPIIGITGSNGKTTSKELIKSVLKTTYNCFATKGNLNNHIGVPLSILSITDEHEIAIIEMGANHEKEIDFLCNIASPSIGIITNIGSAHLEGFKSIDGVIKAKNELYSYIKNNNGTVFVNSDDKLLLNLSKDIKKIKYGSCGTTKGKIINNTPFITIEYKKTKITSRLIGDYQFSNVMLAISIGEKFDIQKDNIRSGIENYLPNNNRSQVVTTNINTLILDAYNANPSSMKAMINAFHNQNYTNKICILGDMLELGKYSNEKHIEIVNLLRDYKLDYLLVGKIFYSIHKEKSFVSTEKLKKYLSHKILQNKTILIKGSRALKLESLIEYL